MDFVRLALGSDRSGEKSVVVKRATAEFFGWDKAFPEWTESIRYRADGTPYTGGTLRNSRTLHHGGKRLRICRAKSKTGYPQGKTHCFRMVGTWSRKHLVKLAAVAGEKFEWMEDTRYQRVDRDVWLSLVKKKETLRG